MRKLRVGLIGLGAVAQIVHIPVLRGLSTEFDLVGGCDVTRDYAETVAHRFGLPRVYGSSSELIASGDVDVVAVVNSDEYHAEATLEALAAGLDVLLEKPAALTLHEIDAMIAERDRRGRQVMVGYMRRHAGAYARMKSELAAGGSIRHVAVRDIIGPNDYFIEQTGHVLKPEALPGDVVEAKAARGRSAVAASLGPEVSSPKARIFRLLCGLASHDLSALRGLVGVPKSVLAASAHDNGRFISVLLDYGSFTATYEMGMDSVGVFDATIEAFLGDRRLRLTYDTPYIRHLPTRLSILTTTGEELVETAIRPSYRDPYTRQWLRFHAALNGGEAFEETLEDGRHDIELAIDIARLIDA